MLEISSGNNPSTNNYYLSNSIQFYHIKRVLANNTYYKSNIEPILFKRI